MSGTFLVVTTGGGCSWHVVVGVSDSAQPPTVHRMPPTKTLPTPDASRAGVQSPTLEGDRGKGRNGEFSLS